jgi:hypothetical protein
MLVTFLLAAGLLAAPATAAERGGEHRSRYHVKELSPTRYVFYGTVSTNRGGRLLVLRKPDGAQRYTVWKKVAIDDTGRFRTVLTGGLDDCFRMRINRAHGHRTTVADLGCLVL